MKRWMPSVNCDKLNQDIICFTYTEEDRDGHVMKRWMPSVNCGKLKQDIICFTYTEEDREDGDWNSWRLLTDEGRCDVAVHTRDQRVKQRAGLTEQVRYSHCLNN